MIKTTFTNNKSTKNLGEHYNEGDSDYQLDVDSSELSFDSQR